MRLRSRVNQALMVALADRGHPRRTGWGEENTLAMVGAMSQINDRPIFQVAAFPTGSSELPVKRLKAARALSWAQDAAETA